MMPVADIELFVFLLLAVAILAGLGLRSGVPYPVALVLGGLVIGLVPGLPTPELDPDVVFFVFLPPVLYRLGVKGRTKTILEGESLVNDGTALTAYKIAIAAVGGSAGSFAGVGLKFVAVAAGGIAIGLVAGWVFAHLRRLVTDPSLDVTLSVVTPFVAYVPAEEVGASGVLATVAAGLYIGTRSLDIIEPGTRLRTLAFWESAAFLLDGLLFLLIGVQVPSILDRIDDVAAATLTGYALAIFAVVMGVRCLWMLAVPVLLPSHTSRGERIAIAWSGMRGGVSLAAALAITHEGFPDRDLVIFVAYAVIVLTLVVPGLTLAPLVRRLGLVESEEHARAGAEARLQL